MARFPQLSRSGQDDHNGSYKKLIEARFMEETTTIVVFVVWDSSTIVAAMITEAMRGE